MLLQPIKKPDILSLFPKEENPEQVWPPEKTTTVSSWPTEMSWLWEIADYLERSSYSVWMNNFPDRHGEYRENGSNLPIVIETFIGFRYLMVARDYSAYIYNGSKWIPVPKGAPLQGEETPLSEMLRKRVKRGNVLVPKRFGMPESLFDDNPQPSG